MRTEALIVDQVRDASTSLRRKLADQRRCAAVHDRPFTTDRFGVADPREGAAVLITQVLAAALALAPVHMMSW